MDDDMITLDGVDAEISSIFRGTSEPASVSPSDADTQTETTPQESEPVPSEDGNHSETAADDNAPDSSSAEEPAAEAAPEPETFLALSFGDASGRISQADAERIGASVGLSAPQLIQAIADGHRMQEYSAAIDALQDYVSSSGMDLPAFVESMNTQLFEMKKLGIISDLKTSYPDADQGLLDKIATEQANREIREARDSRAASAQTMQQTAEQKRFDAAVARWSEVNRLFPDVKSRDDIPADVYAACNNGADPVEEMYRFRLGAALSQVSELEKKISDLNTQFETEKKNASNRMQSAGSMSGAESGKTIDDEIRDIFLS